MTDPAEKKKRATYQDVLDAPAHLVAEIIDGDLRLSPRPAGPHTKVSSTLGYVLGPPFDLKINGPGGWIILDEPELHFGEEILVPDLAGWRRERLAEVPDAAYFTLAPDWICEVLSKSTETMDRAEKLAIYAAAGVHHAWLVHPLRRTLEVMRLHEGKWLVLGTHVRDRRVRAEPFEAIELDLALVWADNRAGAAARHPCPRSRRRLRILMRPIVLALPKGRILDEAAAVFARAGYDLSPVFGDNRKLVHDCGMLRVLVLRSSDIATYVAHGAADVGVAGSDVLDRGSARALRAARSSRSAGAG